MWSWRVFLTSCLFADESTIGYRKSKQATHMPSNGFDALLPPHLRVAPSFFSDPSSAAVGCAKTGPIQIADNIVTGKEGEVRVYWRRFVPFAYPAWNATLFSQSGRMHVFIFIYACVIGGLQGVQIASLQVAPCPTHI
jgi:hypothetical protein